MINTTLGAITKTIPISMFNRGLAGKIFEEVKKYGTKVVMKNNVAEAVLVSPDEYLTMCNEIEDLKLALMAKERLENSNSNDLISQLSVDQKYGFSEADLKEYDTVEFE